MSYRLDDDCELPPHLVRLFLRTAPGQLRELLESCERRDAAAARAQAHKLKGGLYAAGASHLAESTEALRTALGRGDWASAEAQLLVMRSDFASLLEQLAERLTGESA